MKVGKTRIIITRLWKETICLSSEKSCLANTILLLNPNFLFWCLHFRPEHFYIL